MLVPKYPIKSIYLSQLNKSQLFQNLLGNDYLIAKYICIVNVHSTVTSDNDPTLRNSINSAWLALADGKPLSVYANLMGCDPKLSRITGPELMIDVLDISSEHNWRHYFYGSTQSVLADLDRIMEQKYPDINYRSYSPPFGNIDKHQIMAHIDNINSFSPHFIWIGLGAPKQEIFMLNYRQHFKGGVLIGVGAGFDYLVGRITRAPYIMQALSLEWVFRLIQEPRRLWKRYLITNTRYILYTLTQMLRKFR